MDLEDCTLDRACFVSSCMDRSCLFCTTANTRFFRCDLRGVNLGGRRRQNTRFTECRFHGIQGQPVIGA